MTNTEWLKLVRDAKENNRYRQLRYALNRYWDGQQIYKTFQDFINEYTYDCIFHWYQRSYFRNELNKSGLTYVNVPRTGTININF